MKFNAVNNKEGGCVLSVSGQCVVAHARSALLESSPCALYSVSWRPISSFWPLDHYFVATDGD